MIEKKGRAGRAEVGQVGREQRPFFRERAAGAAAPVVLEFLDRINVMRARERERECTVNSMIMTGSRHEIQVHESERSGKGPTQRTLRLTNLNHESA